MTITVRTGILLIALVRIAIGCSLCQAQTADVTIDATKRIRTVCPEMFGLNCAAWDSQMASSATLEMLDKTSVKAFRYPGGSWADGFDWTKPGFVGMPTTGTFFKLVSHFSGVGDIIANYGSGSPQMAAAWAAYCNGKASSTIQIGVDSRGRDWKTSGYWATVRGEAPLEVDDGLNFLRIRHEQPFNFRWFEIGNECWGSWENDVNRQRHDPVLYAQFFITAMRLIKAVAPGTLVGAVITGDEDSAGDQQETVVNPRTNQAHSGWTAVLFNALSHADVVPDFVIYHNYPEYPGAEDDRALLSSSSSWRIAGSSIRVMLNDYFGASATKVKLVCTEFNCVTFNPGKESTSLVDGLYLADSFGAALGTEFDGLYWWNLRNAVQTNFNNSPSLYGWRQYGDYGILSAGSPLPGAALNTPYPTYFAMEVIAKFCSPGDTVIRATSNSSDVSAYGVRRSSGAISVLVINKSASRQIHVNLSFAGFRPARFAAISSYGEAQDDLQERGVASAITESRIGVYGKKTSTLVFPYSMTVFQIPVELSVANSLR